MKTEQIKYFNNEKKNKNPVFFDRFPKIKYKGLKILDFGCGHGAISIALAEMGAKEIVGVDLDEDRINFAKENLQINYPHFIDKVKFKCMDFRKLDENYFDLIISKATFEHVIDLDVLLINLKNKLNLGGKLISGFGPLYNAPSGDHKLIKHPFPWAHLFFSKKTFLKKINKHRKVKVKSIHDLGLNGYSFKKYKEILTKTPGLIAIDFRTNVSKKKAMKFFNLFTYVPFLKEYFTYNIYCTLERID